MSILLTSRELIKDLLNEGSGKFSRFRDIFWKHVGKVPVGPLIQRLGVYIKGLDYDTSIRYALSPVRIMKNRYIKFAKISEVKFRQLLKHFAFDLDAQRIAVLCKLNRKECEFRLNYHNENIYAMLLKMIRQNPLF